MVPKMCGGLPLVELLEQVWELGGVDRNGPGADHLLYLVRHRRCWLYFHSLTLSDFCWRVFLTVCFSPLRMSHPEGKPPLGVQWLLVPWSDSAPSSALNSLGWY